MPQISFDEFRDEFRKLLFEKDLYHITEEYIFKGIPYVFRNNPEEFERFKFFLSDRLGVLYDNITIVGSGKVGFSLNPDNFMSPFTDNSDIDIVIVDERLFNYIYKLVLNWNYPRRLYLEGDDWDFAKIIKNGYFWGWFEPSRINTKYLSFRDALKPLRDISYKWFKVLNSIGKNFMVSNQNFNVRLYKTWHYASLYHVHGLIHIKRILKNDK